METLKDATAEIHKKAEQMPFNQRMMNGELSKEEYGKYLVAMKGIYAKLEETEPLHPALPREDAIEQDIVSLELDERPEFDERSVVTRYIDYLGTIPKSDVWAHMYLHYLAIVFGGQMIKEKVPGDGNMYDFNGDMGKMVGAIREKQEMYERQWIPEVTLGYDRMIKIFDELDEDTKEEDDG